MVTVVSLLAADLSKRSQEVLDPGGSREIRRLRGISRVLMQSRYNQPLEHHE